MTIEQHIEGLVENFFACQEETPGITMTSYVREVLPIHFSDTDRNRFETKLWIELNRRQTARTIAAMRVS